MVSSTAEAIIREIYAETAAFYDQIRPRMDANAFGYKILYGPPLVNAPIVFMGINPGGVAKDYEKGKGIGEFGEHGGWPSECEYAASSWNLARALQSIFDPLFLKRCTGLNANFFRSKDVDSWRRELPVDLRKSAEQFSSIRAKKILDALAPRLVVAIGFSTLDTLCDKPKRIDEITINERQTRPLITKGAIFGHPTLAIRHLTASFPGAKPTLDEIAMIRDFMTNLIRVLVT